MKKLLLLFFSVIIISNSYSQNFVQEGKQWNVLTYAWLSELTCFNKLEGDTVIDSKLYKKVWYSCDSLMIDWSIMDNSYKWFKPRSISSRNQNRR